MPEQHKYGEIVHEKSFCMRKRGTEACSVAIESIWATDGAVIRTAQQDAVLTDSVRAAEHIAGAAGDAAQNKTISSVPVIK